MTAEEIVEAIWAAWEKGLTGWDGKAIDWDLNSADINQRARQIAIEAVAGVMRAAPAKVDAPAGSA